MRSCVLFAFATNQTPTAVVRRCDAGELRTTTKGDTIPVGGGMQQRQLAGKQGRPRRADFSSGQKKETSREDKTTRDRKQPTFLSLPHYLLVRVGPAGHMAWRQKRAKARNTRPTWVRSDATSDFSGLFSTRCSVHFSSHFFVFNIFQNANAEPQSSHHGSTPVAHRSKDRSG